MKKRVKVGSDGSVPLEGEVPQSDDASNTSTQSPVKEQEEAAEVPEGMQILFFTLDSGNLMFVGDVFCCFFLPLHFISWTGEGNSDPTKLVEALQKRVKRQENLLQKCKEVMRTHKERSAQLSTENETLQEQLQERLQELEKIKVACS